MSVAYFIFKNGHQSGPFTFRQIERMQQGGAITLTDQVRRDDQEEWKPIGKIRDRVGRSNLFRSDNVLLGALALIAVPVVWVFAMIWWMWDGRHGPWWSWPVKESPGIAEERAAGDS